MLPDDPKPPSIDRLIRRVVKSPSPVRDLRDKGALGAKTPLAPKPLRSGSAEDKYEIAALWDEGDDYREDVWGYAYENEAGGMVQDPDTGEWQWTGKAVLPNSSTVDTTPAEITEMPTSTIYPPRPRTVAAGYSRQRKVLTVIFRDGTLYNYYDVDGNTWRNFKSAHSKGMFIKRYLDGHRRGAAGVDHHLAQEGHLEALYRAARTAQIKANGRQRGQVDEYKRRRAWNKSKYAVRNSKGNIAKKANNAKRANAWNHYAWRSTTGKSRPY